jgi:archaellin
VTVDDFVKIASVFSPIILAYLAYLGIKAAQGVKEAKAATEQVAETLAVTKDVTTAKLDEIYVRVDGRLTEALEKIDRLEVKLFRATGEGPMGKPPQVRPD